MARLYEPTPEEEAGWKEWVEERPPAVRDVARRFFPWELYRMKSTKHRVGILAFGEEEGGGVTLRVFVSKEWNLVTFERSVFGIDPDDLEPCELPAENELVGAMLTEKKDILEFIEEWKKEVAEKDHHHEQDT